MLDFFDHNQDLNHRQIIDTSRFGPSMWRSVTWTTTDILLRIKQPTALARIGQLDRSDEFPLEA
jgi:hypothetical protein